jgi:large conductance mechanosensitive channel
MGKVDFSSLFLNLSGTPQPSLAAAKAAGTPTVNYGVFLQTVFDFIIIAFVIFMLVKQVNRLKTPEAAAAPTTKDCPQCLSTIPIKATKCAHCTSNI